MTGTEANLMRCDKESNGKKDGELIGGGWGTGPGGGGGEGGAERGGGEVPPGSALRGESRSGKGFDRRERLTPFVAV